MFNNEILSYSISTSPNFWQTREMLKGLFERLPKTATPLLHSDQGWQYQMKEFQRLLKEHNVKQSMSRKGNCLDNSVMENFFGRLKVEMYYGEKFESVNAFIQKLHEYINYYNNSFQIGSRKPWKARSRPSSSAQKHSTIGLHPLRIPFSVHIQTDLPRAATTRSRY